MDKLVSFQLFKGGAEGLVGNAADISLHLVETYDTEFHQGVEYRHLVFPIYQGKSVAEAGRYKAFIGNTSLSHFTLSFR